MDWGGVVLTCAEHRWQTTALCSVVGWTLMLSKFVLNRRPPSRFVAQPATWSVKVTTLGDVSRRLSTFAACAHTSLFNTLQSAPLHWPEDSTNSGGSPVDDGRVVASEEKKELPSPRTIGSASKATVAPHWNSDDIAAVIWAVVTPGEATNLKRPRYLRLSGCCAAICSLAKKCLWTGDELRW